MTLPVTLNVHRSIWVSAYDGMARQWALPHTYVNVHESSPIETVIYLSTKEGVADLYVQAGPSLNTMATVYRNGDMVQGVTVNVP